MEKEKEIKELRGAAKKVYHADNSNFKAVYSANARHYYDEEAKEYRPFDNRLVRDGEGRYYLNRAGSFKARFSREDETEELFTIEKGMYKVTVSANRNAGKRGRSFRHRLESRNAFKNNVPHKADIRTTDVQETDFGDAYMQSVETVLYSDVYDGADIEYFPDNAGVKENIIINEKQNTYHYSFMLNCENVTCRRNEDGSIRFYACESGDEVFYIPAPFMYDAGGETSYAITQELRKQGSDTILTLSCSSEWINSKDRVFPVTVDPQIRLTWDDNLLTYSYDAGNITYNNQVNTVGGKKPNSESTSFNEHRVYIYLKLADLVPLMRIKKAELKINQKSSSLTGDVFPRMGLYKASDTVLRDNSTDIPETGELIDYTLMKAGSNVSYTFDITAIANDIYAGRNSANLVLKLINESDKKYGFIELDGDYAYYDPELIITYEPGYAASESYRCHTHELGRFGKGLVDLSIGSLAFDSTDFAWAGNRMPVTIKHMYNSMLHDRQYSNDALAGLNIPDFSSMGTGKGFRLNLMQGMVKSDFVYKGVSYRNGYIYTDENGNEMYFRAGAASAKYYDLYGCIDDENIIYDPVKRTFTISEKVYMFDTEGRLIKITDSHENTNEITYTDGRITSVTDGAGRTFNFEYTVDGYLASITAPDETAVCYSYDDGYLTGITYPNGEKAEIGYSNSFPNTVLLKGKDGKSLYRVSYEFSNGRVCDVTEYGVQDGEFIEGVSSTYSYNAAARSTEVSTVLRKDECDCETEDTVINTVYIFDDDGNTISEYVYTEDGDNLLVSGGDGINPYMGKQGTSYRKHSVNTLIDHDFSYLDEWHEEADNCGDVKVSLETAESLTFYGRNCVMLTSDNECSCEGGIYQTTSCEVNENEYTFSAYVNVLNDFSGPSSPGIFIRVTDISGNILSESEHLNRKTNGYVRLAAAFNKQNNSQVKVHILISGKGTAYADAAQFEKGSYEGGYSIIKNGNFVHKDGNQCWYMSSREPKTRIEDCCLKMQGDLDIKRYTSQTVLVKRAANIRETFTLSGWAKANALPKCEREAGVVSRFRLRAVISYNSGDIEDEEFCADFSPCTDGWQYASVTFSKSKYHSVSGMVIYCDYDYNTGEAWFDNISLVRNSIETGLSQSDFVKVDDSKEEDTHEEGQTGAGDETGFTEQYDPYGNPLTETTFKDGEYGTIYRSFGYNDCCCGMPNSGNDRIRETDARGNATLYKVDPDTSKVTEITDRCGNKTQYTYDKEGNTTKTTVYNESGDKLAHVAYAYDSFNNMTGITRSDGMKYNLSYNEFHNLSSIGINGKADKLVSYEYREGNGRLKKVHYANGDMMKLTYNRMGQVTSEKWFDRNDKLTAHYRYVYDGEGNVVRSVDVIKKREYNYMYENSRIKRASECIITLNPDDMVTKKTLINSILYSYDKEGRLVKKVITSEDKTEADTVINYEHEDKSETVINTVCGSTSFTSHSGNDSFGRKSFDEIQTGFGFLTRQFSYHKGEVTSEHRDNGKLKSGPVTQLVKRIEMSDGRVISYEYDNEERITKITDSINGETEYTYDSLGQLLTEVRNGVTINEMTYDKFGNITGRNGITYTYGTGAWKDLLTGYGDKSITYDSQGNPVNYLGHTLAWEKGRQLKSFDGNTYTYNADGIRTGKTVNGVKHTYRLDGTKILSEKWGTSTLTPLYDNEDEVCGIIHNGAAYYFIKNLQGDVISIKDSQNRSVAEYSYDAWGVCSVVNDETEEGIAEVNPFRYRSYYYDSDTGMYYLQSRYYDPVVGRWLNSDEPLLLLIASNTQQYNICCYCENSPIKKFDLLGYWAVNLKTNSVAWILDLILLLLALSVIFFAQAKLLSWSRKIFSWAKKAFDKLINKIANVLANSLDTILYELLKKYNSVGKARISIGATVIAAYIYSLIDLTPGKIVANLIDRFDKDGKSGYIRF